MTTKNIPAGSKGVYYGPGTPAETLVNKFTITTNPSGQVGSKNGDDAVNIYGVNGITLVNTGTINATYSSVNGNAGYGVQFDAKPGLPATISITNTSTGVIEDTGGYGFGVDIQGGTLVNYGFISGGSGVYAGAGVVVGNLGTYISNASTGTIAGGGIIDHFGSVNIVNAGKILGFTASNTYGAIYLKGGGSVTNLSTGTISPVGGTAYGIKIAAGAGTVTNAGYINGGGGNAVSLAAGYTNLVVVDPGARFHGIVNGGTTAHSTLELGSGATTGTLTGFNSEYINFGTLTFAPSAQWLFETNTANIPGVINGFVQGDTIDIVGFTAASISTLSGNKGVVLNRGATHETISFSGTISNFEFNTGSFGTDLTTICFCVDTLIGTPDGEVPVQTLQPGDTVLTAHNGPRKVIWVGIGKVLATRGKRSVATPVIVRKGALADNVPHQDLHVTKAHSLYIDEVLVPVEFLVNHRTIVWDDRAQEVEIYHVELESHDVLIANGVPAESFRDNGNRWLFQNARSGGDLPPQEPYAPVLTGGPVVDAAWRKFLERAGPHPGVPTTDDPDLHLMVDGRRVEASSRSGVLHIFRLTARPVTVRIVSRTGVPQELGLARDPRCLGVALRQIMVSQGVRVRTIEAEDISLTDGFHGFETDNEIRWTDGDAAVPASFFEDFLGPMDLALRLGGSTSYVDSGAVQRVA
jgi:antigen 43